MWYYQTYFLQIQRLPCKSQMTKSLWLLVLNPHPLYFSTILVKAGAYVVLHLSTTFTINYKLLKYVILSAKYWGHSKCIKSLLLKSQRIICRSVSAFSRSLIHFLKIELPSWSTRKFANEKRSETANKKYLRQQKEKKN